ncbi:ornithine cyclodeaminase family protein [Sphingosinicella sp.]|uniref:ornithine cyclodeaminase family protein n=1 Tax=Sphingosinicella sp. TaxID=1917971 RepID=UPI004037B37A
MSAAPRATLILTRHDVAALMDRAAWLEAVETGFRAVAAGKAAAPPPMAIEGLGGIFHAKGASLALDRHYVALKLNGNFPGNPARGLPTIQGALLLCDGETGALLAIMDSIEVTLRRTAAASALAARFLARADSSALLICGCGAQGLAHIEALRDVLPVREVLTWDRDPEQARALAKQTGGAAITDLVAAARRSDVIVTCTTAGAPFLDSSCAAPGGFIAAVGADSPQKSEIAPNLMARANIVTDLTDQAAAMGDLHHAIATGAMTRERVHAELAELVTGGKPGRSAPDELWLFDSTGTALQDVVAAAAIYARAAGQVPRSVSLAA